MFVGHYGPSLLAKSVDKTVPLWLLFIAVQFVDVLWALFVLMGIERVRIVPGFTASNALDLYYMPYTHSLVGALAWSILAYAAYRLVPKFRGSGVAAVLVGAAVFSHWVLDLLVHKPDLPLYDNTYKVGFGLWDYPVVALTLEAALFFGGLVLYLRVSSPTSGLGRYGMVVFGLVMFSIQTVALLGPPPPSDKVGALMGLSLYIVFAGAACWLESKRI
ncbi:hypothetical protein MYX65_10925 [Acidobacteria bacterium AH-259-L09]|nr:hypothetical protein [Acidobacteria bacterium AH-259-L09]